MPGVEGNAAVNERWTYLVIANEPGGTPIELRITLEDRDSRRQATIQVTVAGAQVDVDDKARDFEAPEWQVRQILEQGGVGEVGSYLSSLQEHMRTALDGT